MSSFRSGYGQETSLELVEVPEYRLSMVLEIVI